MPKEIKAYVECPYCKTRWDGFGVDIVGQDFCLPDHIWEGDKGDKKETASCGGSNLLVRVQRIEE